MKSLRKSRDCIFKLSYFLIRRSVKVNETSQLISKVQISRETSIVKFLWPSWKPEFYLLIFTPMISRIIYKGIIKDLYLCTYENSWKIWDVKELTPLCQFIGQPVSGPRVESKACHQYILENERKRLYLFYWKERQSLMKFSHYEPQRSINLRRKFWCLQVSKKSNKLFWRISSKDSKMDQIKKIKTLYHIRY